MSVPTFAFWHKVLPPGLSQRWGTATGWACWQKLALSSIFQACCRLGARRSARRVHVRALSSSSKPHWTGEQTAAQMTHVYLRRALRKMPQKVVLCVPLKAPLKGSGSLVDVPLWDSRRTQSPSMHPALPDRCPSASEPRRFIMPRGNEYPFQCSFKLSCCKLSWFRSYLKAALPSCSKEKAFWQTQPKSFAIHESNPWNVLNQQLKMGRKTRHRCLVDGAANSTGLLLKLKLLLLFLAPCHSPLCSAAPSTHKVSWSNGTWPTVKPTQKIFMFSSSSHCPLSRRWVESVGVRESHSWKWENSSKLPSFRIQRGCSLQGERKRTKSGRWAWAETCRLLGDGGTKRQWLQVTGTSFGARSALPKLRLWQLAHNRQNKGSPRSGAEEQRKPYERTKELFMCAWLMF